MRHLTLLSGIVVFQVSYAVAAFEVNSEAPIGLLWKGMPTNFTGYACAEAGEAQELLTRIRRNTVPEEPTAGLDCSWVENMPFVPAATEADPYNGFASFKVVGGMDEKHQSIYVLTPQRLVELTEFNDV